MGRPIGSSSGVGRQRQRLLREISQRIVDSRVKSGISQTILAERIGSTQQRVSFWEHAKALPDVDALLSLSIALQVKPGWLAFGEVSP